MKLGEEASDEILSFYESNWINQGTKKESFWIFSTKQMKLLFTDNLSKKYFWLRWGQVQKQTIVLTFCSANSYFNKLDEITNPYTSLRLVKLIEQ